MIEEIRERRSIRTYKPDLVEREKLEEILRAGMLAPSSKNRQPWHFVVAEGQAKQEALTAMEQGIEQEKRAPLMPGCLQYIGGAEHTLRIMREAPVLIFVINRLCRDLTTVSGPEERIYDICNAQSIGAAIENMTLTAVSLGLGSLWICDSYFAQGELNKWLHEGGELAAVLAVGYADETPQPRPRETFEDTVEFRN